MPPVKPGAGREKPFDNLDRPEQSQLSVTHDELLNARTKVGEVFSFILGTQPLACVYP
jgi:hypothetical protein